MRVLDYNGQGRWGYEEVLARYARCAGQMKITPRDLSPSRTESEGAIRIWPVMNKVIEGISWGDAACIRIGVEFIEEDAKFPFGKLLKANTARKLRRATLDEYQKARVRRRVFGLLRAGHVPHEFRQYARLARRVGFRAADLDGIESTNRYVLQFVAYFERCLREDGSTDD